MSLSERIEICPGKSNESISAFRSITGLTKPLLSSDEAKKFGLPRHCRVIKPLFNQFAGISRVHAAQFNQKAHIAFLKAILQAFLPGSEEFTGEIEAESGRLIMTGLRDT